MPINPGLMSSKTTEWETPPEIFDPLDEEFSIIWDVCASVQNSKCGSVRFFQDDSMGGGLTTPWADINGPVWMNPPYGKEIGKWVKKAYEESVKGATVVCLLPARTDTSWFQDYIIPFATEIRFLRGRIKFIREDGKRGPAPFPSAVVIFGGKKEVL